MANCDARTVLALGSQFSGLKGISPPGNVKLKYLYSYELDSSEDN